MDFAFRYVRFYPGVNSRAELVTLAPGLRLERRFAPLARGLISFFIKYSYYVICGEFIKLNETKLNRTYVQVKNRECSVSLLFH